MQSDIKEDLNKWNNVKCSWIRRLSIVKMSFLFKFNNLKEFLKEIDKVIVYSNVKDQEPKQNGGDTHLNSRCSLCL